MSEEASPEQKLNIANYFIMSSPPGEVDEVVKDVKTLVADDNVLSDAALSKILADYNNEQYTVADSVDGDRKVLVTPFNKVDQDSYVDPVTGNVAQFDHNSRNFTGNTDQKQSLNPDVDAYRSATQSAVETYMSGYYKNDKGFCSVYGADDGTITVCVSSLNSNLSNFWSGGWRSTYSYNSKTKGTQEIKGSIKVTVHYFEDGNVQLHGAIAKTGNISVSDEEGTGKSIAEEIQRIETEFQEKLEEMFVDMHRTTFKQMRRFMPVTRQPMDWSTNAHSLASEIGR